MSNHKTKKIELTTLYARKEPTTDSIWHKYGKGKVPKDVVLYQDGEATEKATIYPWYYSNKPRRNQKTIIHNCWRFKLKWLPELTPT